jgi:hypothetical protein
VALQKMKFRLTAEARIGAFWAFKGFGAFSSTEHERRAPLPQPPARKGEGARSRARKCVSAGLCELERRLTSSARLEARGPGGVQKPKVAPMIGPSSAMS